MDHPAADSLSDSLPTSLRPRVEQALEAALELVASASRIGPSCGALDQLLEEALDHERFASASPSPCERR